MGSEMEYRSGKCSECGQQVQLLGGDYPVAHAVEDRIGALGCDGQKKRAVEGSIWVNMSKEAMDRTIAELNGPLPTPGPAQSNPFAKNDPVTTEEAQQLLDALNASVREHQEAASRTPNPFAVPAPVPVPTADCAWCGRDGISVNALGLLATHYPPAATGWCLGSGKRPGGVKGGAVPQMPANPFLVEQAIAASPLAREEFLTELKKAPGSSHYHGLDPQPIEVLRAWNLPYCRSVAIKYLARAGQKGTPADAKLDLQKAIQYIEWAIEDLPEETE